MLRTSRVACRFFATTSASSSSTTATASPLSQAVSSATASTAQTATRAAATSSTTPSSSSTPSTTSKLSNLFNNKSSDSTDIAFDKYVAETYPATKQPPMFNLQEERLPLAGLAVFGAFVVFGIVASPSTGDRAPHH